MPMKDTYYATVLEYKGQHYLRLEIKKPPALELGLGVRAVFTVSQVELESAKNTWQALLAATRAEARKRGIERVVNLGD